MASWSRRPSTSRTPDPLLTSVWWRTVARPYWQRVRDPCRRCHLPIDYDSPRYWPGTRKVNPKTLVVGHVVGRHQARALGWTDAMINTISNTQPEHARCSDRSGARYGIDVQRRTPSSPLTVMINDW